MNGIPFSTYWKTKLNVNASDFRKGHGIFAKTQLRERDVDVFFSNQEKIHREACLEYGKLEVEAYRFEAYDKKAIIPAQWKTRFPGKKGLTKDSELTPEVKEEFKKHCNKIEEEQKALEPNVFYQITAIEWCQELVELALCKSFNSPIDMYAKLNKENKEIVNYFLVQCGKFFQEKAVKNLVEMKNKTDSMLLLVDYEIFKIEKD